MRQGWNSVPLHLLCNRKVLPPCKAVAMDVTPKLVTPVQVATMAPASMSELLGGPLSRYLDWESDINRCIVLANFLTRGLFSLQFFLQKTTVANCSFFFCYYLVISVQSWTN
jgi:hypothetical protein